MVTQTEGVTPVTRKRIDVTATFIIGAVHAQRLLVPGEHTSQI
jgi:hypothetical protein